MNDKEIDENRSWCEKCNNPFDPTFIKHENKNCCNGCYTE